MTTDILTATVGGLAVGGGLLAAAWALLHIGPPQRCQLQFSNLGPDYQCLKSGPHRQHIDQHNNVWTVR